jgi:hypothetical protein
MYTDTPSRRGNTGDISSRRPPSEPTSQLFPIFFSSINAGSVKPDNYREVEVSLQKLGYSVQQTYKLPKLVLYLCIDPLSRGIVVIQDHVPQVADYVQVKGVEGKFIQPPERSKSLTTVIFSGSYIVIYNYGASNSRDIYQSNHGDETQQHGISLYTRYLDITANVSRELEKDFVNDVTVWPLLEIGQNATNILHDIVDLIDRNRDISNTCTDNVRTTVGAIQSKRNEVVLLINKGNQNAVDKFRGENERFMAEANEALAKNLNEANTSNITTIKAIMAIIDNRFSKPDALTQVNADSRRYRSSSSESAEEEVKTIAAEVPEVVLEASKSFPSRTRTDRKRPTSKEPEVVIELDSLPKSIPEVEKKVEVPSKSKRSIPVVKKKKKHDTSSDSS